MICYDCAPTVGRHGSQCSGANTGCECRCHAKVLICFWCRTRIQESQLGEHDHLDRIEGVTV